MKEEELTARRIREIIAKEMSKGREIEILPDDIEIIVSAKMVCINMNEDYAPQAIFEGARIRRRK